MWEELAHNNKGHLYPTAYYWWAAQFSANEVGVTNNILGCWYKDHEFGYLSKDKGLAKAGKVIFARFKNDKSFLDKIIEINQTQIPPMVEAAARLTGTKLKDLSGKELYKRWEDWLQKFISMMTWSVMATVMEMEEPYLSNELERILKNKLGEDNIEVGEYFQILTTATDRTVAGKEEIELLKLKLKEINSNLSDSDMNNHLKSYSWIGFGYDGPGWNINDIKNRLKDLPSDVDRISQIINKREVIEEVIKKRQREVTKELKLNNQEQHLFNILKVAGFWKFERKFINQKAHEMMEDFIKEIGRRYNLSVPQVKMIAPNEMKDVLVNNKVNESLLNERIKECIVVFNGLDYQVLSGQEAKGELDLLYKSFEVDKLITKFTGNTAYPGKVEGVVKIVDKPEDMRKMKEGDVLVSASTSPDILLAMKKAGAIVTNSGGITCHAAIVAREIQTPTVIGTKFASKVLKDGDRIEVDATKGIIRKI